MGPHLTRSRRRAAGGLLFSLVVAAGVPACSSDAKTTSASETTTRSVEHYALLDDPSWTLKEALDPPPGDLATAPEKPPLDWYAEYERLLDRGSTTQGQMVRLSGHATTVDQSRAQLEQFGIAFTKQAVAGWRAVRGRVPGEHEALILLEYGDSTLLILSYELDIHALAALAAKIEPADAAAWTQAGGVIR